MQGWCALHGYDVCTSHVYIQLDMREREFQSFSPPATLSIYLIVFACGKCATTKINSLFFKKAVQGGRANREERTKMNLQQRSSAYLGTYLDKWLNSIGRKLLVVRIDHPTIRLSQLSVFCSPITDH